MSDQRNYEQYKEKMKKNYQYNWICSHLFLALYLMVLLLMIAYGILCVDERVASNRSLWPYIVWSLQVIFLFLAYQLKRCPVCNKHMGLIQSYRHFLCKHCGFNFKETID